MATLGPSEISDQNYFSNSESLCCSNASHQVGLNLHYSLGGDTFWRISKWPSWQPSWKSEWNKFSSSESPSPQCLPPSFSLTWLTFPEQMLFQDFHAGHHGCHLGYWNGTNLAILNLYINQNASHQVWAQFDLPFGSRHGLKIFKMATLGAILDTGMEWF